MQPTNDYEKMDDQTFQNQPYQQDQPYQEDPLNHEQKQEYFGSQSNVESQFPNDGQLSNEEYEFGSKYARTGLNDSFFGKWRLNLIMYAFYSIPWTFNKGLHKVFIPYIIGFIIVMVVYMVGIIGGAMIVSVATPLFAEKAPALAGLALIGYYLFDFIIIFGFYVYFFITLSMFQKLTLETEKVVKGIPADSTYYNCCTFSKTCANFCCQITVGTILEEIIVSVISLVLAVLIWIPVLGFAFQLLVFGWIMVMSGVMVHFIAREGWAGIRHAFSWVFQGRHFLPLTTLYVGLSIISMIPILNLLSNVFAIVAVTRVILHLEVFESD